MLVMQAIYLIFSIATTAISCHKSHTVIISTIDFYAISFNDKTVANKKC